MIEDSKTFTRKCSRSRNRKNLRTQGNYFEKDMAALSTQSNSCLVNIPCLQRSKVRRSTCSGAILRGILTLIVTVTLICNILFLIDHRTRHRKRDRDVNEIDHNRHIKFSRNEDLRNRNVGKEGDCRRFVSLTFMLLIFVILSVVLRLSRIFLWSFNPYEHIPLFLKWLMTNLCIFFRAG